jgi:hypothetical protein
MKASLNKPEIGMALIILGLTLFWVGWHNADLGQNYFRLYRLNNLDYSNCIDCNELYCMPCDSLYMNGTTWMFIGFYVLGIGMLMFGTGEKR